MKNELIAMINSMNNVELERTYQFVKEMMETKKQIEIEDETKNYIKYRSLCLVPQELLQIREQSNASQQKQTVQTREEYLEQLLAGDKKVSEKEIEEIFSHGREMLKNGREKEGFRWIRFAAVFNLKEALFLLGYCCEQGIGTQKDIAVAKKFYRRAASLDSRFDKYRGLYGFGLTKEGFEKATLYAKNIYGKESEKREDDCSDVKFAKKLNPYKIESEYNELMEDGIIGDNIDISNLTVLGSNIPRTEIYTITFLNSVKEIPADHWDVSKKKNGSILAWVVENGPDLKNLFLYSEKKIMASNCKGLFAGYMSLTEIHFNNWFSTGKVSSMNKMFMWCYELRGLDLSNFDTSRVVDMGYMFCSCHKLVYLKLSSFNTSNVVDMTGMFRDCFSLTELLLSVFDTSNVVRMDYMFCNCQSLKMLNLSNFRTSNVVSMNQMFSDCYSLKVIICSSFDTSKVQAMEEMFSYCSSLTELNLFSFDFRKVKTLDRMFLGCRELVELNIPLCNTLEIHTSGIFDGCEKLPEKIKDRFECYNTIPFDLDEMMDV